MNKRFNIDESVFTYAVSSSPINVFTNHKKIFNNTLTISYTNATEVLYSEDKHQAIAVIGFCIDAHREIERESIPAFALLQNFSSVVCAYHWFNRFAGKYVILYKRDAEVYVWGDATCSIPISYTELGLDFYFSSSDFLIAKYTNVHVSDYLKRIRLGSDFSQALPHNLTLYDGIKVLLPNHYLIVSSRKAYRVSVSQQLADCDKRIESILSQTLKTVINIALEYSQYYSIKCPLTAGYDSRVNYAILGDIKESFECYTFRHTNFKSNEDDVIVPSIICQKNNRSHVIIDDIQAPNHYIEDVKEFVGDYVSVNSINIAYTYNSVLSKYAQVNGDIIDQIGKSLIGNSVPNILAIPTFFQCKTHNHNKQSKKEIKKHLQSIINVGDKEHIYDLYAIEHRCGRWASQTSNIYSVCGISSLNFFNCRELLLLWLIIPRRIRSKKVIHKYIINSLDTSLLQHPFNPNSKIYHVINKSWILFFISTFFKHFILKK